MAVLVPCLVTLRHEVDVRWPHRDRSSDGWIGDAAHAKHRSDHNPDSSGEVHALDIDADGIDPMWVVNHIVASHRTGSDARATYVIHDRRIWGTDNAWKGEPYTGSNPHTGHIHISASNVPERERDTRPWLLPIPAPSPSADTPGRRRLSLMLPRMRGHDVAYVQRYVGARRCGHADGVFGPVTDGGVRWYQRMRGIRDDGVVGPVTWREMGVAWTGS